MGLVEHALGDMPEAHRALWLRAGLIVKLAASRHYVDGDPMNEVLAVIADPTTLIAQIVSRFFGVHVVQRPSQNEPLVAVLIASAARRVLLNFPSTPAFDLGLPKEGFRVLTAPHGVRPGLSICRVIERARLS